MRRILSQLAHFGLTVATSPSGRGRPPQGGRVRVAWVTEPDSRRLGSGRSRELRRAQNIAEKHAWYLLRDRRALGLKFRRQVPIEDFIVDFYCDELKLVIEIDGDLHDKDTQRKRDQARDERLRDLGYRILRFPNALIINDPDVLLETIRALRPSPGAPEARRPLPEGEAL